MQALVHFFVGIGVALLVLTVVDWPVRREFLLIFASGTLALVPDVHWLFRTLDLDQPAQAWHTFHRSAFADVFWFHRAIDLVDDSPRAVEVGIGLAILLPTVLIYYYWNDWTVE